MVYWGGERRGGKRGRGAANKVPFVAAVSLNGDGYPISMNMAVVKGFRLVEIAHWAKQHVQPGSTVISDGLPCFTAITQVGCSHINIVTGGGPQSVTKEEFTWVNTMIGNVIVQLRGLILRSTPGICRVI
jgi:ISXO2-like transposase domain